MCTGPYLAPKNHHRQDQYVSNSLEKEGSFQQQFCEKSFSFSLNGEAEDPGEKGNETLLLIGTKTEVSMWGRGCTNASVLSSLWKF